MSEKRFFITGNMVIDGENIIPSTMWQYEEQQKKYCDELNKLYEAKKQLKQGLEELKEIGDYQAHRINELQEFEDKVFDSLNDKIKRGEKAIEWGESIGADVGAMGFHIESLKQFKKELYK